MKDKTLEAMLDGYAEILGLEEAVQKAWSISQTHDVEMARLDKVHCLLVDARDQVARALAEYKKLMQDKQKC